MTTYSRQSLDTLDPRYDPDRRSSEPRRPTAREAREAARDLVRYLRRDSDSHQWTMDTIFHALPDGWVLEHSVEESDLSPLTVERVTEALRAGVWVHA